MYIGVDLGASWIRAILIDDAQRVIASKSSPLMTARPQPGWSEQDPAAWWRGLEGVFDQLAASHAAQVGAVRGIGLCGQMYGAVLLDGSDKVLRPAILADDVRASDEARDLGPDSERITGNGAMPGCAAPKLLWIKRHEPEVFAQVRTVLAPKDYLRMILTGDKASDLSDASGTLWLSPGERSWSGEMLERTGLGLSQMPTLFEGCDAGGQVLPALAERWGMQRDVIVAGGAGDTAAAGCAVGAVGPGTGLISIDGSGAILVASDRFLANPQAAVGAFCHAVPRTWLQVGTVLSAAGSLEWLSRILARSYASLIDELGAEPLGPSSVRFLPYLAGTRTPRNDPAIRGAFVDLDQSRSSKDLTQAVLEGVAFAYKDCFDAITAPLLPRRLVAVGSFSRSRYWLSLIATLLDVSIAVPAGGESGPVYGAARLALIAATRADPFDVCAPPKIRETVEPIAGLRDAYLRAHAGYRDLYPAIKEALPA
jgi:xylulokinase